MNDELKKLLDKLTVLPMEEYLKQLENGGILVCARVEDDCILMQGNLYGNCAVCNKPIVFRPYNEIAINKVCIQCALLIAKRESNA